MQNKFNWQFYHWHLEPSSKCALKCPRCPRTEYPDTPWLNKELSLSDFKKVFTPDMMEQVKRITMCGDVGDPIYCKDYLKIIEYIKLHQPTLQVYTITNGSYKTQEWWKQFASLSNKHDTINFSVDGHDQESNNKYRVNSDWESIMNGMEICGSHSDMFVNWAMIVFKFNQDHIDSIKKQAINIGCDQLQVTYSTKFGSKYGENYGGDHDDLEPDQKYISRTNRYERHIINLSQRSPVRLDYMKENINRYHDIVKQFPGDIIPMCLIGNRGLYLNAEGVIFPCSWTSFPYESLEHDGKIINWKDGFFAKHRQSFNIKGNRSVEEILNDDLWRKLFDSFKDKNKSWVECRQKCHRDIVSKKYAVGYYTN